MEIAGPLAAFAKPLTWPSSLWGWLHPRARTVTPPKTPLVPSQSDCVPVLQHKDVQRASNAAQISEEKFNHLQRSQVTFCQDPARQPQCGSHMPLHHPMKEHITEQPTTMACNPSAGCPAAAPHAKSSARSNAAAGVTVVTADAIAERNRAENEEAFTRASDPPDLASHALAGDAASLCADSPRPSEAQCGRAQWTSVSNQQNVRNRDDRLDRQVQKSPPRAMGQLVSTWEDRCTNKSTPTGKKSVPCQGTPNSCVRDIASDLERSIKQGSPVANGLPSRFALR